jgi:peptidyl-prolyl cis-trans isomerase B (cyclophilin B)
VNIRLLKWLPVCLLALVVAVPSGCGNEAAVASSTGNSGDTDGSGNSATLLGGDNGENNDSEAPAEGELTDQGLVFKVPYERGEGTITLARQNGLLRVDAVVRMPYHAGDHGQDSGANLRLAFSVNGTAGRFLIYQPSPLWAPSMQGSLTAYRMEASYSRTEGIRRLAERPAFVAESDIRQYDHWSATMWVDMRRLIVPGNSPDSRADTWRLGGVMGSVAGMEAWPEGFDYNNPGQAPQNMVRFKLSELPELDELDEDPRDRIIEHEAAVHEAMRRVAVHARSRATFPRMFEELKKARDQFPNELWPRDLLYQVSRMASQQSYDPALSEIDQDYAKYLLQYIEASPGQSRSHIEYMMVLLRQDRLTEAQGYLAHVMQTPLVTGRKTTEGFMKLEWADMLIDWGFVDLAESTLDEVSEHESIAADASLRINYKLARAKLYERKGDPESAAEAYQNVLTQERTHLQPQQLSQIQQQMQFQLQAQEQWEDELKYQEEDAEKQNPRWIIETSKGRIVVELFEDDAPNTVAALVKLANEEFYDGLNFHRVEPNFVAQGGCPKGDGTGSPGYRLKSEISRRNHFRGTVAMARSQDPNSQGSQFYICVSNNPSVVNLSGEYVVVGRVLEGMDVADSLRVGDKIESIRAENLRDHEYEPETIPE